MNIFEYGLKQQEKRKIELDTFTECIQEAIQENQEQGKLKIAQFEEKHSLVGPAPPEAAALRPPKGCSTCAPAGPCGPGQGVTQPRAAEPRPSPLTASPAAPLWPRRWGCGSIL